MIKPDVPHAIVGGEGKIEHIGVRTPAIDDKQLCGHTPESALLRYESERQLSNEWGHRIPINNPENKNCWLIGAGSAKYKSKHMILAFLDFPTYEAANAGIGTRHQMHLHQKSWEYYLVLQGRKTLRVEDHLVSIETGEMLAVPPHVKHRMHSRQAPYKGFTIRVPVELNDKINIKA